MKKLAFVLLILVNTIQSMNLESRKVDLAVESRFAEDDEEYNKAFDALANSCTKECCILTVTDPYIVTTAAHALYMNLVDKNELLQAVTVCGTINCATFCCLESKLSDDIYSVQAIRFFKTSAHDSVRALFPYLFSSQKKKDKKD